MSRWILLACVAGAVIAAMVALQERPARPRGDAPVVQEPPPRQAEEAAEPAPPEPEAQTRPTAPPRAKPVRSAPEPANEPAAAAPEPPPASACRTALGPRDEQFLYLCPRCNASFSPTVESAREQLRGQGQAGIDCPQCGAVASARHAVCCPHCKFVYAGHGNTAVCPKCKTDAVQWYLKKRNLK